MQTFTLENQQQLHFSPLLLKGKLQLNALKISQNDVSKDEVVIMAIWKTLNFPSYRSSPFNKHYIERHLPLVQTVPLIRLSFK